MVYGVKLNLGDYVEIRRGVHDDRIPAESRDGLIVELISHDQGRFGSDYDQARVMFHNGVILKFHKSQIKIINKSD